MEHAGGRQDAVETEIKPNGINQLQSGLSAALPAGEAVLLDNIAHMAARPHF